VHYIAASSVEQPRGFLGNDPRQRLAMMNTLMVQWSRETLYLGVHTMNTQGQPKVGAQCL
jgi:hypothetical protein